MIGIIAGSKSEFDKFTQDRRIDGKGEEYVYLNHARLGSDFTDFFCIGTAHERYDFHELLDGALLNIRRDN